MEQDKKTGTGAPSSDTTSALFVSQRKKQLEQQEVERRAKEKEEQRIAAEAEVRKLEREVEERKRKAEEDARQVAEEARIKKEQAAANPDAVLGGATKPPAERASVAKPPKRSPGDVATAGKPMDMKKVGIIGGAVAVVAVIIIVIVMVSGGGGSTAAGDLIPYSSSQKGISFSYPKGWQVDDASAESVTISSEDLGAFIILMDITNQINEMTGAGMDIVSAAELVMKALVESMVGGSVDNLEPQLQKSGSLVTGSAAFTYDNPEMGRTNVDIHLTVVDGRCIIDLLGTTDEKKEKQANADYETILSMLEILSGGGSVSTGSASAAEATTYMDIPGGYGRFFSENGLTMGCPDTWTIADTNGGFSRPVVEINSTGSGFMYVINYADEGAGLSGQDAYDAYVDQVISLAKLKQENIVSASAVQYEQFGDGMEEYFQSVDYAGILQLYVSLVKYNDEAGNIQAVFIAYPSTETETGNAMSAIWESIEAA